MTSIYRICLEKSVFMRYDQPGWETLQIWWCWASLERVNGGAVAQGVLFLLGVGKVVSMDPFPPSLSHYVTWGAQTWGAGRGLVLHSTVGPCGELRSWSCAREMGMGSQGFSVPSLPDKSPPCSGLFLGVIFWVISCSCTICLNLQMKQYLKEIGAVSIHLNRV